MKNEFKTGDFCRFPNEEIPRVLDILRANGHPVWRSASVYNDKDNIIICLSDGDMSGEEEINMGAYDDATEFSRHDFMCKALRLEEGMGMRHEDSTKEQRQHIHTCLSELGVIVYEKADYSVESGYPNLYFDGDHITGRSSFGIGGNFIPYLEWCKRLCIEPIGLSSQDVMNEVLPDSHPMKEVEPVFDPSKPWEFRAECSKWANGFHYIGIDHDGRHVVRDLEWTLYFIFSDNIRNIPEFNASMLEVGEWMEITEIGIYENLPVQKMQNGYLYCPEHAEVISNDTLKGRCVDVEIKVKEL